MIINISKCIAGLDKDLIVLNRPNLSSLYKSLYSSSSTQIITDGAANHLLAELGEQFNNYCPSFIIGDLDSLTPSSESQLRGINILKIEDQDHTDLEKALMLATSSNVFILTDFGGRLDHTLGAFHAILKPELEDKNIFLYGPGNISFAVRSEATIIADGWKYCGILPFCGKTRITTEGFSWNMNDFDTEFGGFISVCNELLKPGKVRVDKPVIMTFSQE